MDVTSAAPGDEALRAAELLELILASVADGVVVYDREGRILRSNAAADAILGYAAGERAAPLADRLADGRFEWLDEGGRLLAPEQMPSLRAARLGETLRGVVLRRRGAGGERWLTVSAAPLVVGGERVGAVVSFSDVTDRKRAEEAQARLAAIVESSDAAIVSKDRRGTILTWNAAAERLLGWRADEIVGRSIEVIVPPELRDEERDLLARVNAGELVPQFETRRVRKDGAVLDVAVTVSPIRDRDGKIIGVSKMLRDVTAQKRAQEALRESQQLLRSTLDHFPTVIAFKDREGRFLEVNAAVERALGLPKERIVGRTIHDFVPREAADVLARRDAEVMATRRAIQVEETTPLPTGTRHHLDTNFPLVDASGRVYGTGHISHDITDVKRAEAALRDANERLREADRRKDEFLGMLSHELRNPLAPIRNALFILERADPRSEQARRAKEIAARQVAHITRLVDDLLDVTRIARGKIELRRAHLDVVALGLRVADDHRALMHERGLELAVEAPPGPLTVDGDDTRLAQVLGNLLHNASKFTPRGGRVTLAVQAAADRVAIHVRDTGVGLAPGAAATIFEPFTQAEQTLARSEGGLGLGLALVKGLVALHGGSVEAVSDGAGRGTDFVVTLPRVAAPSAAADSGDGHAAPGVPRRHRVLVVDDNRDAAETLAELVSMLGHDVDVAFDGPSALRLAEEHRPDLVLCDIGLPGMDGYEVARRLRERAGADVRLVALSGYAQPEDIARAHEAGFDLHVAKPPDPERLTGLLA